MAISTGADVIFIMVKNLCDQLEAFGMKNYDAGNLSQIIKENNLESDGIRQSLLLHHNNPSKFS